MLYVTTRSNRDAYTAQRALVENRGPDGGYYVPFRGPKFSTEEIEALKDSSFHGCVAQLINMLFNTQITPWDLDFWIGRYPVRLEKLNQRVLMGECWHNLEGDISRIIRILAEHIRADQTQDAPAGDWVQIGVRIAVLFGIFGELVRAGIAGPNQPIDIAAVAGDFTGPMSLWYARECGLPIGNIIICCNENNALWDLFHHGAVRTDVLSVTTSTPEADIALPAGLERLIHSCGGPEEAERFVHCCRRGAMYCPDDRLLARLRRGIFVSVVSSRRVENTIPSVYGTNSYLLSPYGALAYAGLMDYRAGTGESRYGLVFCEKSPVCDLDMVARSLKISPKELKLHLDRN